MVLSLSHKSGGRGGWIEFIWVMWLLNRTLVDFNELKIKFSMNLKSDLERILNQIFNEFEMKFLVNLQSNFQYIF